MKPWFKPKRYGLGAAPASWEGWALTIAYVVAMAVAGATLALPESEAPPLRFIIVASVLTIVFIGVAWRTTEGGWRWRWGGKD